MINGLTIAFIGKYRSAGRDHMIQRRKNLGGVFFAAKEGKKAAERKYTSMEVMQ